MTTPISQFGQVSLRSESGVEIRFRSSAPAGSCVRSMLRGLGSAKVGSRNQVPSRIAAAGSAARERRVVAGKTVPPTASAGWPTVTSWPDIAPTEGRPRSGCPILTKSFGEVASANCCAVVQQQQTSAPTVPRPEMVAICDELGPKRMPAFSVHGGRTHCRLDCLDWTYHIRSTVSMPSNPRPAFSVSAVRRQSNSRLVSWSLPSTGDVS